MEAEEVLKLIDSYWFSREIFKKSPKKIEINSSSSTSSEESPAEDKEKDDENSSSSKTEVSVSSQLTLMETEKGLSSKKITKKGLSKSLSELEFEEIKGFMDLGFVFSEEDYKDSSLAEIIPGLQRRIGREIRQEKEKKKFIRASRPYLSEAWEVLEMRKTEKKKNPLMNWRVPNTSNEIDMKDSLKWWAHTVASTVIQ